MNEIIKNNILADDKLIQKIKNNFTESDMKIFELNYRIYKNYRNNDFTINLDEIYDFIGFTRKNNAKRLLSKEFQENIDYIINRDFALRRAKPRRTSQRENIIKY